MSWSWPGQGFSAGSCSRCAGSRLLCLPLTSRLLLPPPRAGQHPRGALRGGAHAALAAAGRPAGLQAERGRLAGPGRREVLLWQRQGQRRLPQPPAALAAQVASATADPQRRQPQPQARFPAALPTPQVCLVYRAGELAVIEYGCPEVLATCRTEHASPYLLSVVLAEARGALPPARAAAYLVDAQTARLLDLATGQALATVSHDARIDWLVGAGLAAPLWGCGEPSSCKGCGDAVSHPPAPFSSPAAASPRLRPHYPPRSGAQPARQPPAVPRQAPPPARVRRGGAAALHAADLLPVRAVGGCRCVR
jgi:hypothetical protein